MKVLYYHQHFSTPSGSTGNRSYAMAKRLLARGHEVTMICGSYEGGETGLSGAFHRGRRRGVVDGIEVIELELPYSNSHGFVSRSVTFLRFAWRSTIIALRSDVDLVVATSTPLTAGIPGIVAHWVKRTPFVFEVRDLWPELPREMGVIRNPFVLGLMSLLEWVSYRSATRLIGLSPGIVAGIQKRGVSATRIAMIPNGCDLEIFSETSTRWRPSEVGSNYLMAVFTGTHGIANGLDSVLDVAAELKRRGRNDIKLVLIGDGKCKAPLIQRANDERLDNVVFLPPIPKSKLAGLLAASDLGLQVLANVQAFYFGTSPNKFFDYLAAGLPVLNNYPGWLADIILENHCGYVVPPDDPIAFADALTHAAENPLDRKERGRNARKLGHRLFSRDSLAEKFVDELERSIRLN